MYMNEGTFSTGGRTFRAPARQVVKKRTHFTLIEVMIAFLITGATVAAAMGLLKTAIWSASFFSHRTAAANIANSRVERLRTMPYVDLETMEEDATPVNAEGILDADGDFVRTTVVGSEYYKTRTVTITVGGWWKMDTPRVIVSITSIVANDSIMH